MLKQGNAYPRPQTCTWLNSWPPPLPIFPHIGPFWHGSLELCLLIPEPIRPFTHFETIKWPQWLLGPHSIGTSRKGKPAGIGLNDENYCAQKESIGAFQRNSILFTKGLCNLKMEMLLCLECMGKRWQKKTDSLQVKLRTVHLSNMWTCVLQNTVEFVLSATAWIKLGYRFHPNNYCDVVGMQHTSSLTYTKEASQRLNF